MSRRTHDEPRWNERSAGFSLVELMVSVVVMGIVLSHLLFSFSHQHTSSLAHERAIEIQQEVRLINDVILADVRSGGFMVPAFAAVASVDGGANGPDILCVSDSTVIDDAVLPGASSKFPGATVTTAFSGISSSVTVAASTMDVDSDGDVDFAVDDGILIGTGTMGHCAVITGISGGDISFEPATAAGFSVAADDVVVPAIVYQLNGSNLMRNTLVLSNFIEDIQVQFGVDADLNGTVEGAEFPIDDLTGQEFDRIENVRVSLTARDRRPTDGFAGQFAAVANRVAGPADNFKRRRTIGDTALRNLQ